MGMVLPGALAAAGALLCVAYSDSTSGWGLRIAGVGLIAFGALLLVGLGFQLWFPRIGYEAGTVTYTVVSNHQRCIDSHVGPVERGIHQHNTDERKKHGNSAKPPR